ncbi:sensor domain-containing diguanylate cyclase [Salinibacter ruber]|uniref:sensor domain-containing diguanylate cyclase n=1 Tax=Salinibacter ruber TaxID=146919 RepID=UPI00161E46AA|nr:sensor domain-containing diguanylate cyclase [Salinibacter ruber]MBB4090910.1 diguanylate cyclase (GGDEF)-like protein [Salinibacter ruber]
MSYPLPDDEGSRLDTLRRLHIYGTESEKEFDQVTDAAQTALGTQYSAVNLIYEDRQWSKATCGINLDEAPREDSFCARAMASGDTLVVEDLATDERFADNPFVTEPPNLRFYAGVPLTVEESDLGTLCVFDDEPRSFTQADRKLLEDLAGLASELLEARLQTYRVQYLNAALEQVDEPVSIIEGDPGDLDEMEVTWVNLAYAMSAPDGHGNPVGKAPWLFAKLEEVSELEDVSDNAPEVGLDADPKAKSSERARIRSALQEKRPIRGETSRKRLIGSGANVERPADADEESSEGEPYVVSWLLAPIRNEDGQVTHWMTVHRDITGQKIREEKLEHRATRDSLTGLFNRPTIEDRLQGAIDSEDRTGALLYLDLDGFKQVNDTYGHGAGDQLLNRVARVLEGAVRKQDLVGRIGGDEFVIWLSPPTSREAAGQVGRRIVETCSEPVTIQGSELVVGASVGIEADLEAYETADAALKAADAAMYRSKKSSGSAVTYA